MRKQHHSTSTTLRQTHQVCCWPVDAKKIHVVCGARYFYRSHPQLVCLLEVFRFRVERKRRRYSPTRPLKAHFFLYNSKIQASCSTCVRTQYGRNTLTATFRHPFDLLTITNTTGQRKRRRSRFQRPSSYLAPHSGQSSVRQAKLGVSDWVQVPIE